MPRAAAAFSRSGHAVIPFIILGVGRRPGLSHSSHPPYSHLSPCPTKTITAAASPSTTPLKVLLPARAATTRSNHSRPTVLPRLRDTTSLSHRLRQSTYNNHRPRRVAIAEAAVRV